VTAISAQLAIICSALPTKGRPKIYQKHVRVFCRLRKAKCPMTTPSAGGPRHLPTSPPQATRTFCLPQAFCNQCVRRSGALWRQRV
jgi:hypothetical protein